MGLVNWMFKWIFENQEKFFAIMFIIILIITLAGC
jgi:hypothetical protein